MIMVLEQLFKERWVEKKPVNAFLLGLIYSLIGIISAKLIFGADPGLMSVAFTSLLLVPSLNVLLQREENVEIREKKLSIKLLLKDHKDIFEIYLFLFLGIFFMFAIVTIIMEPWVAESTFRSQLDLAGIQGSSFLTEEFFSILSNNLIVLIACLLLSLVYGAGSIMFITWNASVWGVIFGYLARESATIFDQNPFVYFMISMLPILPHMITEAVSYISAAIVGGVVSKAVLREKLGSKKFKHVLTDALILFGMAVILVIIAAFIEVYVFPVIS